MNIKVITLSVAVPENEAESIRTHMLKMAGMDSPRHILECDIRDPVMWEVQEAKESFDFKQE